MYLDFVKSRFPEQDISPALSDLLKQVEVLGILNLTPDSFSDGDAEILEAGNALCKAQALLSSGADFIDLGAESTRPGASAVDTEEEIRRIDCFLSGIRGSGLENRVLSLDSRNPQVVKYALENYAQYIAFINDVSGLQNPQMLEVISASLRGAETQSVERRSNPEANKDSGVFLDCFANACNDEGQTTSNDIRLLSMHSAGGVPPKIKAADVTNEFYPQGLWQHMQEFWSKTIELCQQHDIAKERLILDPGLGFGKNLEHSLEILDLISKIKKEFDLPVLIGASRKSFLKLWNPQEQDLDLLTLKYNLLAVEQGADLLRLH